MLGEDGTLQEAEAMIGEVDNDSDGHLSYAEFVLMLSQCR